MSHHEQELREALLAYAPLMDKVQSANSIGVDEVDERTPRPIIVFAKQGCQFERGLDNSIHSQTTRFDIQVVSNTRETALLIARLVREALEVAGQPPMEASAGYDPETGIEAEIVSVDWWT